MSKYNPKDEYQKQLAALIRLAFDTPKTPLKGKIDVSFQSPGPLTVRFENALYNRRFAEIMTPRIAGVKDQEWQIYDVPHFMQLLKMFATERFQAIANDPEEFGYVEKYDRPSRFHKPHQPRAIIKASNPFKKHPIEFQHRYEIAESLLLNEGLQLSTAPPVLAKSASSESTQSNSHTAIAALVKHVAKNGVLGSQQGANTSRSPTSSDDDELLPPTAPAA